MATLSQVVPLGDMDTSGDEVFVTAPNSPEKSFLTVTLPEKYLSSSDTPRSKKKVSWTPLPPKIVRMARTPTRSISTAQLDATEAMSSPFRPGPPAKTESPQSNMTPTRQLRHQSSTSSIFGGSPEQGRDQSSSAQLFQSQPSQQSRRYEPLPGNPTVPLDICADGLFKTKKFEAICTLAMEIACMIPMNPPPSVFISLDLTPMHPWFESLVAVFTECFAKRLRERSAFPQKPAVYAADGSITHEEDHVAFEEELVAHVNAIFASFNTNWDLRAFGSHDDLVIDTTQRQADIAAAVLREVTEKALFPPKANWKVGESLHPFYKAQLRRFRGGVVRIIEDWEEDAWILTVPEQLERGVAGYEEYYIAHIRHKMLVQDREG